MQQHQNKEQGFTLIQMSVALIVIGFIIGGVLTGKQLKDAAAQSAQIAQIQKYQTAVITFQQKYNGYLPGDIPNPAATQFGFQSRGTLAGEGDGNGILEGNCSNTPGNDWPTQAGCGELAVFWQDLSTAGLIDASIPTGANQPNISTHITGNCCISPNANPGPGNLYTWLPQAKLGNGNFIYAYSGTTGTSSWTWTFLGNNYFGVSLVNCIGYNIQSVASCNGGNGYQTITVQQAYNIDTKIDDGLPQSGTVIACYQDYNVTQYAPIWAAGNGQLGAGSTPAGGGYGCVPTTAATPYASTNCFDNNNAAGTQTYSISKNAKQPNCALSFQFQTQ